MNGAELIRIIAFTFCLALGMSTAAQGEEPMPQTVDINTADAVTLAAILKGVGVVKAEAIIRYREKHGDFATIEELANVSGIGMATIDRNQERIKLGDG